MKFHSPARDVVVPPLVCTVCEQSIILTKRIERLYFKFIHVIIGDIIIVTRVQPPLAWLLINDWLTCMFFLITASFRLTT